MDPYTSPYIIPNNSLHNPFPHSLLRTRQPGSSTSRGALSGLGFKVSISFFFLRAPFWVSIRFRVWG